MEALGRPRLPVWAALPLYAVGVALLLTACDALCHVWWSVLVYHQPTRGSLFPGQPTADVFQGFLQLGVFVAAVGWASCRALPAPGLPRAAASTAIFVACYASSGVFQHHPGWLTAAFLAGWFLHLGLYPDGLRRRVGLSVLFAVLGPPWEGHASAGGFFHYHDQAITLVPAWLAGLYLHGGVAVSATVAEVASWTTRSPPPSP